jgi:bisphosphoglycerate-dependent phosphoglycerate mutase
LGGHRNKQRFIDLQTCINQLIDIQYNTIKDADLNKKNNVYTTVKKNEKINHYQQMFTNVILNDVCFNIPAETDAMAKITGESYLDLIVDKHMGNGERLVLVVQRVARRFGSEIISNIPIGVLVIGIKSHNRWFAINPSSTNHKGILK